MGISFSCPFSQYSDVENALESVTVKSISLGEDEVKTLVHTVSFNRCDQEPMVLKSLGSGKMMLETSVSFKGRDLEEMVLVKAPSFDGGENLAIRPIRPNKKEMDNQLENIDSPVDTKTIQSLVISDPTIPKHMAALKLQKVYKSKEMDNQLEKIDSPVDTKMIQSLVISDPTIPKHMAALKLQKVYKSFRTRRRLADCAVLVEQSWWKLLDFAELKRSSISFFEIEKHETAISRWSRARTRAAKVGKGLSKNDRAQKLALRHWLEAIDPRHRYGHNLHFYYVKWLHCQSKEPFFYWLDIGEGKEVNQVDKCPRSRLQQQCIKYLGPKERMAYEVGVEKGTFFYKQSGEILHTAGEGEDDKWIFVLSTSKVLYVGKKKKGKFQHSSFLAGGATTAAGRLVVENGILKALWPHSGHYRPTEENFKDFVSFLRENNVNVCDVQMNPIDEEADSISKQRSSLQNNSSKGDLIHERSDSMQDVTTELEACKPKQINLGKKLSDIEIPRREILFNRLESEDIRAAKSGWNGYNVESLVDGNEMAEEEIGSEQGYMIPKKNLFDENVEESKECEIISEESILKRINSHKGINSFQLGKQLTCKWTTGAGPRIGCVRDYPSKLQSFALEQVSLSPKSAVRSKSYFSPKRMGSGLSPKVLTPKPVIKTPCTIDKWKSLSSKSVQHFRTLSLPLLTGTPVVANMS